MSAPNVLPPETSHFMRENLPDTLTYLVAMRDPLYAMLWGGRSTATGRMLNKNLFHGGHRSYANWRPGGNFKRVGKKGRGITMSQNWCFYSMTFEASRFMKHLSNVSREELIYDELEAQLQTLRWDWENFQIHDLYSDGTPYLVEGDLVQPIDGVAAGVGDGEYANLDPDDPADFPTEYAHYWRSHIEDLTAETVYWDDLIDEDSEFFFLDMADDCLDLASDGADGPNLAVCDRVTFSAVREIARRDSSLFRNDQLKIAWPSEAHLGYNVIWYREVPFWWCRELDRRVATGKTPVCYFFTTRYWEWKHVPEYDLKIEGPETDLAETDAEVYAMLSVQQLRCIRRDRQAKIIGLPADKTHRPA